MKRGTLILAVLALLVIACGDKETPIPSTCPDTAPTYDGKIKSLIQSNCATAACHGPNGTAPGRFDTYEGLVPYFDTGIFKRRVIEERSMPQAPRKLSDRDFFDIKCWVEANFPEK